MQKKVIVKQCKDNLEFYLKVGKDQALMFIQENDDPVTFQYFQKERSENQLRHFSKWGMSRKLDKTIQKLTSVYIDYTYQNEIYPFHRNLELKERHKKPYNRYKNRYQFMAFA